MADPILLAHLVAPNSFDLGGLAPTSIRDQMIRGKMLVDRAIEAGLIGARGLPLLVVGAGVGGVTAAVCAAQHGVDVLVIEEKPIPFFRQANCRTRWVDPTQYDWSVGHWPLGQFPWTVPWMPLSWQASYAHRLAITWTRQFNRHRRGLKNLSVAYQTTLSGYPAYPPGARGVQVHLRRQGFVSGPYTFGMLLLTRSYGTENTTVNSCRGFEFWDSDPFAQPNLGLPVGVDPHVLISGAGDGALQDLLRILTGGRSAKEIFELVYDAANPSWVEAVGKVRDAEDQAQRAYSWGERKRHDHAVFSILERRIGEAIDVLQSNGPLWRSIESSLSEAIGVPPVVTLVHSCSHFASNYPLNRFLVLLIKRYLDPNYFGRVDFRSNERVVDIAGAGSHLCAGSPTACHGEPHTITTEPADCGGGFGPSRIDEHTYNVVIVRHGAVPVAPVLPPVSRPRQVLPYHAPA